MSIHFRVAGNDAAKRFLSSKLAVQVQTKNGKLTISGKRERSSQPEGDTNRRFERHFGKFSRQVRLPEDADCATIKAKVDNGVLTVRVGKLTKLPGVEDVRVDF